MDEWCQGFFTGDLYVFSFCSFSFPHVCNRWVYRSFGLSFSTMTWSANSWLGDGGPRERRKESTASKKHNKTNGFEDLFSVCFGIALGSSNDMPSMNVLRVCLWLRCNALRMSFVSWHTNMSLQPLSHRRIGYSHSEACLRLYVLSHLIQWSFCSTR